MIWEQIRKNDSQEFLKMAALNNSENAKEEKPFGFCEKFTKNATRDVKVQLHSQHSTVLGVGQILLSN